MSTPQADGLERAPTIVDVAHRAGVSKSTVSNVIQGKVPVGETTRARVLEAIAELGYRANVGARYMRQRSRVLGVVVGDLGNPFHAEIAAHIEKHAATKQHSVLLVTTGGSADVEVARVQALVEHRVAAVVFAAFSGEQAVLEMIPANVPCIFVSFAARGGISISVDDRQGASLAVEHLLELGHTRIAYVSTTLEHEPRTDAARFGGFRRSLESRGLSVDDALVVRRGGRRNGCRMSTADELTALLSLPSRPTGVFSASDFTALEVMEVADSLGLDIPGDLSLVGFDDIAIARLSRIQLTTVVQPIPELVKFAVAAAIDESVSRSSIGHNVRLSPHLAIRASTAPPGRLHAAGTN